MNLLVSNGKTVARPRKLSKEEKAHYSIILVEDEEIVRKATRSLNKMDMRKYMEQKALLNWNIYLKKPILILF